jgi:hypothetical protein
MQKTRQRRQGMEFRLGGTMKATLYDELDAVIDIIDKEIPIVIREKLRNIRDRLPDEIEEVTIAVDKDDGNAITDVFINGKPCQCYCLVPKKGLQDYLEKRF